MTISQSALMAANATHCHQTLGLSGQKDRIGGVALIRARQTRQMTRIFKTKLGACPYSNPARPITARMRTLSD